MVAKKSKPSTVSKARKAADNPNAFKHQLNRGTANRLAASLRKAYPKFDAKRFLRRIDAELEPLELKQRVALFADAMADGLPSDYPKALELVLNTLGPELDTPGHVGENVFYYWPHAHFVQTRGLEHFDRSLQAMVEITKRATSEFAVRPFINKDATRVLDLLKQQVAHPNPHVRRWVSEGTRPRLPWGERLAVFVDDPKPALALLEKLRNDPSLYVRTSVANHLGDIAKDHPDLAVSTVKRWLREQGEHAEWIAQRALRHPIKAGHPAALEALGVSTDSRVQLEQLTLSKKVVSVGEKLEFTFHLCGTARERLVIDYAVKYQLAKGKTGRKVYKLRQLDIEKGQRLELAKQHSFRPITTRTYYAGKHQLEVVVNGKIRACADFDLKLA